MALLANHFRQIKGLSFSSCVLLFTASKDETSFRRTTRDGPDRVYGFTCVPCTALPGTRYDVFVFSIFGIHTYILYIDIQTYIQRYY